MATEEKWLKNWRDMLVSKKEFIKNRKIENDKNRNK